MALRLNSKLAPAWFTPESQQDAPHPARFQLKPLSGLYVMGLSSVFAGGQFNLSEAQGRDIVRNSLVDWDGIEDEHGNPLPCVPENFDALPAEILGEIVGRALTSTTLLEDERKNLPPQSSSPATPAPSTAATASGAGTATTATQPQ